MIFCKFLVTTYTSHYLWLKKMEKKMAPKNSNRGDFYRGDVNSRRCDAIHSLTTYYYFCNIASNLGVMSMLECFYLHQQLG